ncbi:MAG TPA: fibronectin type III domain-containing protein [Candidatus Eisenbacteria bacterium]|jgi:phosphodiesterase/alkaline phosphatase D-like protein
MRSPTTFLLVVLVGLAGVSTHAQGQAVTSNSIRVSWTTPGDDSLTGTASQFDLRYSTSAITASNFNSATRWTGTPTPTTPGTRQSATVTGLTPSTTYYFAIKTADEVPNWSGISNILSQATLPANDTIRPAPITTVAVTGTTESTASLRWTAVGDDSLTGTATTYDVRFSTSPITASNWGSANQAAGEPAPASAGTTQNFTVSGLTRQTTYYFAVRVSDEAGNVSALSNVVSATTPDQTSPAAIRDLVVGFVWVGWHGGFQAALPRVVGPRDRRGS